MKRGIILSILIVILLINLVSALNSCCEQTLEGEYCKYTDESDCNTNYQSTYATCEQTSFCQIGCCYSSDSGACYKNTPKSRCEAEEGSTWTSDLDCNIDQCVQGCCVIADQAFFVTEVKCKQTASQYEEVSMSFDDSIATEYDCLNAVKNSEWGCCVNDEEYIFTTRDSCEATTEEITVNFTEQGFQAGMLCSNDLLSGDCAKQQYTGCYEGNVYWYDSCGNRENIYSSNKEESYNEGYILEEYDSCEVDGAYDKTCGNCDYTTGSTCGEDTEGLMPNGDFTCIDLTCEETFTNDYSPGTDGGLKNNGESWCIYDNIAGMGRDTVGSRHYRHLCINGEEITEPCSDFREQMCIHGLLSEEIVGTLEALGLPDDGYIEAGCRENRWEDCFDCNLLDTEEEILECCGNEDYRDCYWVEGEVDRTHYLYDKQFTNNEQEALDLETEEILSGICVPQVPPGVEFWDDDGEIDEDEQSIETVCSEASTSCTATWRIGGWKKLTGGKSNRDNWDLIEESPEGCTEANWYDSQNTICKSLGDCGAYKNFANDITFDGFSSNAFDDEFFLDFEDKESVIKANNWEYTTSGSGGEINYGWSWKNKNFYSNPAFALGLGSATVGGISQVVACTKSKEAGLTDSLESADLGSIVNSLGSFSQIGNFLGGAVGGVIGVNLITGHATATEIDGWLAEAEEKLVEAETNKNNKKFVKANSLIKEAESLIEKAKTGAAGLTVEAEKAEKEEKVSAAEKKASDAEASIAKAQEEIESIRGYELCDDGIDNNGNGDIDMADDFCVKEPNEEDEYNEYCEGVKKGESSRYGYCENWAEDIAEEAKRTSALSFTQGIGCFVQGAMPIAGMIGRPVGKISPQGIIDKFINSDDPLDQLKGKVMQQAQGAKTTTRVFNGITTAFAAYTAVEYLLDNETTITYNVECNPWQPPKGGDNCELCNEENTPCSEYKCRSLGAACDLVNEGTNNETCVSLNINDVNSPEISPNKAIISTEYTITNGTLEGAPGFIINELIPAFTPVQLGIGTDEPAQCKWATTPGTDFDDMNLEFGSQLYLYNQAFMFSLGDEVTDEEILALTSGIYTMYVRCSDAQGNANERDYFIRFQVDTTPDLSPPTIEFTSVEEGSYFAYGVNETMISIYTNEPASCSWDTVDTDYDLMLNEMECAQSGYEASSAYYGTYPCTGNLNSISDDEINYFYFRCQDNSGNANEESYKYSTKSSEDTLSITSFEPDGVIANNTVTIEATTEGGADDGKATCKFSTDTDDYSLMTELLTTNSTKHEQELTLFPGEYTLYLTCQDKAGNQNSSSNEITMEYDETVPIITQFYIDEAFYSLVIQTDEPTTCEYSTDSFTFGEGTQMTGTMTETHETSVGQLLYYLICEDLYGNQGSYLLDISLWT